MLLEREGQCVGYDGCFLCLLLSGHGGKSPAHQLHGKTHQVSHPLPSHIVVSRKNQEEIFASLSKNDFRKIISNLEDDNLRHILLSQDYEKYH